MLTSGWSIGEGGFEVETSGRIVGEGGFLDIFSGWNGVISSSSSEDEGTSSSGDDVLPSTVEIFFTLGYLLEHIMVSTFRLRNILPPFSLTSTRITRSSISSLTFFSSRCSSVSSLFASTKMVLANGNRGNFHLHVLAPPFLHELLWPCQFVSSAILTASCPATPTHRVHVTKASVNFSNALSSGTSRG